MAYVKLIHDDRGQNSFTCFQPFVKALENITCKGTYGTLPRHDEYSLSRIGWCHMDVYYIKALQAIHLICVLHYMGLIMEK